MVADGIDSSHGIDLGIPKFSGHITRLDNSVHTKRIYISPGFFTFALSTTP